MSHSSTVVTDYSLKNIFTFLKNMSIHKREAALIAGIKQHGNYVTADRHSNIFKKYDVEGNDLLHIRRNIIDYINPK